MIRAEQPCQVASRVQMELGPFPRDDRRLGPAPCPPPQGGMVFTCGCEGRRKENETAPEHGATPLAQPAENCRRGKGMSLNSTCLTLGLLRYVSQVVLRQGLMTLNR